ncbi:MAG: enoyl-CoA hydratase-related protein [Pseudomonadota bacterium]
MPDPHRSDSHSTDDLRYRVADGVATLTLNRPEALNAMTNGLMRGIQAAMNAVRADTSVRVVVLTGAGRAFCAGADLAQAAGPADPPAAAEAAPPEPPGERSNPMRDIFNPALSALYHCPVPTIARINGAAAGGGFGLALTCDITIAADSAFFVATFGPMLGIVPDMAATWTLPLSAGRARALGIALLGERLSAAQAADWGLIWQCVPDADLDAAVSRATATLKRSSPSTTQRIRSSIDSACRNTLDEQIALELSHQDVLIPRHLRESAKAFMEKREPVFDGTREP